MVQLDEALHGACRTLHFAPHIAQRGGGDARVDGEQQELHEFAPGHLVRQHLMGAEPQHEGDGGDHQRGGEGRQPSPYPGAYYGDVERGFDRLIVAPDIEVFERERLHGLDRVQGLPRKTAGIGDPVLRAA